MPVDCTVSADGNRLVAALTGTLGLGAVAELRERLLKCLAEQPEAVLVDLSGLTVSDPLALAVFIAVRRQAARWPGIPMLLCAPSAATRVALDGAAYRSMPVFATVDAGREQAGIDRESLSTLNDDLLPVPGAARQARNLATEACARWDLPDLVAPACLIASELVSNGVDHAGTMMNLRLTLRPRYLYLAVQDGSTAPPEQNNAGSGSLRGRGLMIVNATAHSWGWLPREGGKVVWAALTAG